MRINDKNFLDFLSILNSLGYKICYIFNGITNTEFVFVYTNFNPAGLTAPTMSIHGQSIGDQIENLIHQVNSSNAMGNGGGDVISQLLQRIPTQQLHFSQDWSYINFISTVQKF